MEKKQFTRELQAKYITRETDLGEVKIRCAESVYDFAKKVYPIQLGYREAVMCVYLNNSNIIIGYSIISIGGLTGTIVDVRLVMQHALLCCATGFIIIHNHPSGTLKPSQGDKNLTEKLKTAGKTLDITLLDHVIITEANGYFSFADENIL